MTTRADVVARRTYQRPKDDGTVETWEETTERATREHHRRLMEEAGLPPVADEELEQLWQLTRDRKAFVAGRTLWLGGTDLAYRRPCCQFNCTFNRVATVYDVVNSFWLLLNGCGVGFKAQPGTLHGYTRPIASFEIVPSERGPEEKGPPGNEESVEDGTWTIRVGDSAKAWAKALGKLLNPAPQPHVRRLVLDFSHVRGAGGLLNGYGWRCNGWKPLARAMEKIHELLNRKAGEILDEIDILDILNHAGTVLSSRRSAEIALMDYHNPRWREFAEAKRNYYVDHPHREQSNNSVIFWRKPSRHELRDMFAMMLANGGSEPGFINGNAAQRRAPWFDGFNPCAEILLANRSFCNLVELAIPNFGRDFRALEDATRIMARANYRQTCVNLQDGVLSPEWHQTNESLRLCGVGLTGIVQAEWLSDYQIRRLRNAAVQGAYSMADELGLPRPKAVTTVKPSGTLSKVADVPEGIHRPLGKHIFNWIKFSIHNPIVDVLEACRYRTIPSPSDENAVLVCFPVEYPNVRFDRGPDGKPVNLEPAVVQLERYRRFLDLWADHNVSITISYSPEEIDEIVDWLDRRWDEYVAVSWMLRHDPTKTAADLGHPYLPQEVVTEEAFREYRDSLLEPDFAAASHHEEALPADCATGACPVR